MGFRPHPKGAEADPNNLFDAAWSTSDISGRIVNHRNMRWIYQWNGPQLINQRYLVAEDEVDKPAEFLRTIVLPPDPVPTMNARIENYTYDESSVRATQDGSQRITQAGDLRIVMIPDDLDGT